jgi:hypothetical protein
MSRKITLADKITVIALGNLKIKLSKYSFPNETNFEPP